MLCMRKFQLRSVGTKPGPTPIGTRWVDVNKRRRQKPEYRSRLVAKEIKTKEREDLVAATPPLEAKKFLFSVTVTECWEGRRGMQKL